MSEINELAAALSKAQGEFTAAEMDGVNPHFKSKYATLSSIQAATRPVLAKNGLSICQIPTIIDNEMVLETRLMHTSGQQLVSRWPIPLDAIQKMGSYLTYAKRYSWSAMCGISGDEDDDGNAAAATHPPQKPAAKHGNGKGKPIAMPEMLAKINAHAEVDGYYNAPQHLINAVGNLPDDYGLQVEYYKEAVAHAKQRRAEKALRVEQATKPDTAPVEGNPEPLFPAETEPDEYYT
jgi:hypothetical protein